MSIALSVIGLIIGIVVLILFTLKGLHISWATIIAALVIMVTSGIAIGQGWEDTIVTGISTMAGTLIPLFLAGATFGRLVSVTGAVESFINFIMRLTIKWSDRARRLFGACLIIIMGILMGYAGIDNFAILFTEIAIAAAIMSEVNIPRKYIAALLLLCSAIGSMFPGTPAMTNIFAAQFLGTKATDGPTLAVVGTLFIIIVSLIILSRMWEKDIANGMVWDNGPIVHAPKNGNTPPWFFLLIPIVCIFICFNIVLLSAFLSILVGIAVSLIIFFKWIPAKESKNLILGKLQSIAESSNKGAELAGIPAVILINMALGNVISSTPAFDWFCGLFNNVNGPIIIIFAFIAMIIIGVSASMSGMIVMFSMAAAYFIPVLGLTPAVAHRVIAFSSLVFDTMPYGQMVVSIFLLTGLTHKEGYKPVFISTVGITFLATILVAVLATLGVC